MSEGAPQSAKDAVRFVNSTTLPIQLTLPDRVDEYRGVNATYSEMPQRCKRVHNSTGHASFGKVVCISDSRLDM